MGFFKNILNCFSTNLAESPAYELGGPSIGVEGRQGGQFDLPFTIDYLRLRGNASGAVGMTVRCARNDATRVLPVTVKLMKAMPETMQQ